MPLTTPTDIRRLQEAAGARFVPFGVSADEAAPPPELVETFDEFHAEYAAIRKGVGLFDQPQRGLVELRGKDRAEFLHRMITHDTRSLKPGQCRRAFLLSKQGRITADMIVLHDADRTLLALDVLQAGAIVRELDKYLFSEEVKLADVSAGHHCIALHGPLSARLVEHISGNPFSMPEPMTHVAATLAGSPCVIYRRDEAGSPGLHLFVPVDAAGRVYEQMARAVGGLVPEVGHDDAALAAKSARPRAVQGRGIGWLAFNTARVEAGVPLFHVDFGPDSLPGETGLLDDAVSFTKGCYLGQEIVARMKHLGHPKRLIVGLRCEDDRLPIAGSPLHEAGGAGGAVIGGITSSTISPLLGGKAIALATIKWGRHTVGTEVTLPAEGAFVKATVVALPFI
jgi:folate-binding protein YgfZ